MKSFLYPLIIPVLAAAAFAQDAFQTPAILTSEDAGKMNVYILAATKTGIRYKKTAVSTDFTDAKRSQFTDIFIIRPNEFSVAMDLFEGRKYEEAKAKFLELAAYHEPTVELDHNYSTLSSFYAMESMRKLKDYQGLSSALQGFKKRKLKQDNHLRQIDLYVMWDALGSESWDRLLAIAKERDKENLPGYQRAQLAYGKAVALHKLGRKEEALDAYNIALTADAGNSEIIAQDSALAILEILTESPGVDYAIEVYGTAKESKNSLARFKLDEAIAVAKLYESTFKQDKPLPANFKKLLELKPSK